MNWNNKIKEKNKMKMISPSFKNSKSFFFSDLLFFLFIYLLLLSLLPHNGILYLFVWIILLLIPFIQFSKSYININLIQKLWILFLSYTFLITLVNFLSGAKNSDAFLKNIFTYLIPFLSILYFSQFCNREYFLKLMRDFLSCVSIIGIIEYLTKWQFYQKIILSEQARRNFILMGDVNSPTYRMTLFFDHPIYLGLFLDIFLLILLFIPFKNKFINICNVLMALFCLVYTQSRSAWLSLIVVMLFYILKKARLRKINIKLIINCILILLSVILVISFASFINPELINNISGLFWNRINPVIDSPYMASGARIANLNLLNADNNIFAKIFGGGDNFGINLLANNPSVNGWTGAIDNQYLTFLLDYGFFGFCIFLIFIFDCFRKFIKTKDNINILIFLSIFLILIDGYFFEFYAQLYINYYLFILICFIKED